MGKIYYKLNKRQDKQKQIQQSFNVNISKTKNLTKLTKYYEKQTIYEPKRFYNQNRWRQSAQQHSRLRKAQNETMYPINIAKKDDRWQFKLESQTKKNYNVVISQKCTCDCPDFNKTNKQTCKHIFFVILKLSQSQDILPYINSEGCMEEYIYQILDGIFQQKSYNLQQMKIKREQKQEKMSKNYTCSFCLLDLVLKEQYVQIQNGQQIKNDKQKYKNLFKCPSCYQLFHEECLKEWVQNKDTCPLCRQNIKQYVPTLKIMNIQI